MSKFMAASKQATEMDHERIRLEVRVHEVQADCKGRAEVVAKAMGEVKELKNLVEELKADAIGNDTHLDYLQKRNDKLHILFGKAQRDAIEDFRVSSEFTDLLDKNYTAGFEDFHMDAMECFPEVDFSSIKLNIGAASTLLQTSSKEFNIEDNATSQPAHDDPTTKKNPSQ